jgi:hypothetical protein
MMMNVKNTTMIAKFSFLCGALLCAGGVVVLFRSWGGISIAEIRLLIGINLLIWGAYFFQVSNTQNLRGRLEALEKRVSKSDSNS